MAQSQSRISNFIQPGNSEASARDSGDRSRRVIQGTRHTIRQYPPRRGLGNPYQATASHLSNFPFASRLSAAPDAPLFHSALDEFREEDDEEEQEREWADRYALERSRRVWGASNLEESSETDNYESNASIDQNRDDDRRAYEERGPGRGRGRGIKSSWNGGKWSKRERGTGPSTVGEELEEVTTPLKNDRQSSHASSGGRSKMTDIVLDSTITDSEPPDDLAIEMPSEESPPAFQQFRSAPQSLPADREHIQRKRDLEAGAAISRPPSVETVPPTAPVIIGEPPRHDLFWGTLYLICLASLFATFFLVFLHTSTPSGKKPLGDTIYTTLRASLHLLAVDTVVAVIVSLVWLALLRSFVRPLVYLIVLAFPVILLSFSLYPFISSYDHGNGPQDKVMRWFSFMPAFLAAFWLYTVYKGRHSLTKAVGILEFSSKLLASNPALVPFGFATLIVVIAWTWIWLGMFTRVFLGGHLSKSGSFFIIDASTWWLGVFLVLMYMWTLSIIGGIQRATTAATVSQWYFHRNVEPVPTSRAVVSAAFVHATTTLFGTIGLSSLLALLIRLPILVLPRRLVGIASLFAYSLIPTPVTMLTNPLSLTYAAIQSQPLHTSARALSQMTFLAPQAPTSTLTPRSFSSRTNTTTSLLPYRLAKLLLYATRFIMATALGFGGWVATATQLSIEMPDGAGLRGSAYAYVVGLVASFIGWGVLGAIEGVLSGIVDASIICWGIEKGTAGRGAYCLEAGYLFGDGREP